MLDKEQRPLHTGGKAKSCGKKTTGGGLEVKNNEWAMVNGQLSMEKGEIMNVLWIVNTNTFLLILLIIMVSYLTTQMNALIRWLKRE